jgi:site-specific DNA-cytosine methylase
MENKMDKKINCLELFSGTGSFGKVAKELDYNVLSLDLILKADIQEDIMTWDYKKYDKNSFDIIWASCPCTEYSKAKTRGIRDINGANKIALKTLEIINYFNPSIWYIENPQTSLLKQQPFMKQLEIDYYYFDADYCMYGKPYRKRTRFWTNKPNCNLMLCDKNCGSFINGKHIGSCGNGRKQYSNKTYTLHEKYSIPHKLIFSLLKE